MSRSQIPVTPTLICHRLRLMRPSCARLYEPVEPRTQPDLRALTHHRRPASSNLSCLGTPNWQIKVFVVRGVANSTLIPIIHNLAVSAPDLASANPGSSHPRVLPSEQS